MKKLNLITAALITLPVFAADYVIVVEKENNDYEVGGFTDSKDDPAWITTSTSCSVDKEESDIYYGQTYNQKKTCIENIERTVTTTRTYDNGTTDIISEVKETDQRYVDPVYSDITGTLILPTCKDIIDNNYDIGDGTYKINPTNSEYFDAYCDMTTDGGGWTLVYYSNSHSVARSTLASGDWNEGATINFSRLYSFKDLKRDGKYEFFIHDSSDVFRHAIFNQTNSYLENPNGNGYTQTGGNFYYSDQASGWKGLALGSYGAEAMASNCSLSMSYYGNSWWYCLQDQTSNTWEVGPWFYDANIGGRDSGAAQWVKIYQR